MELKIAKKDMLLYAVTDRSWLNGQTLEAVVETMLQAGVTLVQLREKNQDYDELVRQAVKLKKVCRKYSVPLIINDNVQAVLDADADGVHIGQDDLQLGEARQILGSERIIGTSAHNVQEAVAAWQNGADYLGCGAVFGSETKNNVTVLDHRELARICRAVPLPVAAIGGINEKNARTLKGTGIDGIAVISALFAKEDKTAAVREMLELSREIVGSKAEGGMEDVD